MSVDELVREARQIALAGLHNQFLCRTKMAGMFEGRNVDTSSLLDVSRHHQSKKSVDEDASSLKDTMNE